MWRFIVVTFGFLGFAFYQLSGGADYQPQAGSRQHAALMTAGAKNATRIASTGDPVIVHRASKPDTDLVPATAEARPGGVQIVLASAGAASAEDAASVKISLREARSDLAPAPAAKPMGTGVATVAADPDKIARLIAAAATSTPEPDAEEVLPAGADLRQVKASRVNMRGGPGTGFDVVGKLTRGEEVEVLTDNGDGWVKLRVVDTGRVGWMADFLLIAAN